MDKHKRIDFDEYIRRQVKLYRDLRAIEMALENLYNEAERLYKSALNYDDMVEIRNDALKIGFVAGRIDTHSYVISNNIDIAIDKHVRRQFKREEQNESE